MLDSGFYSPAFVFGYASAFQAIKAYLFYLGIKERSHGCAIEYMKDKTSAPKELIQVLESAMRTRHEIMYGFSRGISVEDAKLIIEVAEKLVSWVESQMKNSQKDDDN